MWGFVHAIAFMPVLIAKRNRSFLGTVVAENSVLPSIKEFFGISVTFLVVMFGWAFFRADTFSQAWFWITEILVGFDFRSSPILHTGAYRALFFAFFLLLCEWFNRKESYGFARFPRNTLLRYFLYFLLLVLIVLNLSPRQTFIYFQF